VPKIAAADPTSPGAVIFVLASATKPR